MERKSKYSVEQKIEAVKKFKIRKAGIEYLIRLIDIHSIDILRTDKITII
ncbi:MAG: hypothetical protein RR531_10890 [Longicatena sp.]